MKKKFLEKLLATAVAMACVANVSVISNFVTAETGIRYEFEDGTYSSKSEFGNEIEGFSGTGYVDSQEGDISLTVSVDKTDIYDLTIGYCLPEDRGSKNQILLINNNSQGEIGFAPSDTFKEMKIKSINLNEGENTITFQKSWGWIIFDYLTVDTAVLPELSVSTKLSDPNANATTQSLMNYLVDNYGNHIISGQQECYGNADEKEFEYLYNLTGKYPAIRGFDYMNWTQGVNWDDGTNRRIIDWVNNKKGIATVAWHWFVPLDMDNYTPGQSLGNGQVAFYNKTSGNTPYTTFSPAKALIEGTVENEFINKDIDMIAKSLQELQDQDISIIFRPLHEAEGGSSLDGSHSWFWWANDGAETYVELWKYLYNKLTNEYGLHNLIWEWNSYTYETSSAWYPGDEYVDMIAYDKYNANGTPNESSIASTFYSLVEMYNGKKMISMAENDTIPSLENLIAEKAAWSYFCVWYDRNPLFLSGSDYQNADTVKELYQSDYCITLDELPEDLKTYKSEQPEQPTTEAQTTPAETTPVETTPVETTPAVTETTEPLETIVTTSLSIPGGLILPKDEYTLTVGDSQKISYGSDLLVNFESDNPDVVTVDENGNMTAISEGTAKIKLETIAETKYVTVTVKADEGGDITIPTDVDAKLYGDVNDDGSVNSTDIVILNKFLLSQSKYSLESSVCYVHADCDNDQIITSKDSMLIINYVLQIITLDQLGLNSEILN
ncbi:MAG: Ig-like domain-containing protein [Oscillospiraceae bacterium]|nr:Ig-like domain-containing protein [Oscillospiraceae bacterium]